MIFFECGVIALFEAFYFILSCSAQVIISQEVAK